MPRIIIEGNSQKYLLFIGLIILILLFVYNVLVGNFIKINKNRSLISDEQFKLNPEFSKFIKLKTKCPGFQAGNPKANLKIKYFYSSACFWCILEDQYLEDLLKKEGQAFILEKYNREDCNDVMTKYKLSLTPGFVFSTNGDSKDYTVDGYIDKENLIKVICDVTGYCLKENKNTDEKTLPTGQKVKIYFN